MRNIRTHCRISLWILLALQLLLIASYFLLPSTAPASPQQREEIVRTHVSFVRSSGSPQVRNSSAYHTIYDRLKLKLVETTDFYDDFNSSLCYRFGTDLKAMHRSKNRKWNCNCLSGWHGNDCGQPEVIWRALLAYRKPFAIKGPRKYQRRLIYVFETSQFDVTTVEIRINELNESVDLFVLYEDDRENNGNNSFEKNLKSNFLLKRFWPKILYIKYRHRNLKSLWLTIKKIITNLKDDDIILVSGRDDVPNDLALKFLRLYDNWPEPINFRFRWSVYGYFWTHPKKTIVKGGASTISYLYETLGNKIDTLLGNNSKTFSNHGFIVGDLNHLGGWLCEFCYDPLTIIDFLNSKTSLATINAFKNATQIQQQKIIDNAYIENLIENGLYLDGKTELLRTHRSQEKYYAPIYVVNNSWNYDWLLSNLYLKLDYY